jgi:hypothetical protein
MASIVLLIAFMAISCAPKRILSVKNECEKFVDYATLYGKGQIWVNAMGNEIAASFEVYHRYDGDYRFDIMLPFIGNVGKLYVVDGKALLFDNVNRKLYIEDELEKTWKELVGLDNDPLTALDALLLYYYTNCDEYDSLTIESKSGVPVFVSSYPDGKVCKVYDGSGFNVAYSAIDSTDMLPRTVSIKAGANRVMVNYKTLEIDKTIDPSVFVVPKLDNYKIITP